MDHNPFTRKENFISISLIGISWFIFRLYVYSSDWPHIMEMLPTEDFDWVAFPAEYLKSNFLDAMYYFRQEPPFPQLILGVMVKIFGWPFSYPYVPFLLSILVLFSAIFIRDILIFCGFGVIFSTVISVLWCFSSDCVSYEIDAYPKALYELLTGFLFVFSVWSLCGCFLKEKSKLFAIFSLLAFLLIMTRSTLSLFFIIPAAVGFMVGTRASVLLGLAPGIFQLMFAIKNYLIFGDFIFETSSFAATNFMASLVSSGHLDDFIEFSRGHEEKSTCIFYFNGGDSIPGFCLDVLNKAIEKDKYFSDVIGIPVAKFGYGSSTLYDLSYPVKGMYIKFLLENPNVFFDILTGAYGLFWGSCKDGITPIVGLIDNVFFEWLSRVNDFHRYANIAAIHSVFLVAASVVLVRVFRGKKLSRVDFIFIYAALSFLYVAAVSSVADYSENNRYRFAVEPIVWLLPFLSFAVLRRKFVGSSMDVTV